MFADNLRESAKRICVNRREKIPAIIIISKKLEIVADKQRSIFEFIGGN
jgi:hypothetical protein